jgi:hypothetical protein
MTTNKYERTYIYQSRNFEMHHIMLKLFRLIYTVRL